MYGPTKQEQKNMPQKTDSQNREHSPTTQPSSTALAAIIQTAALATVAWIVIGLTGSDSIAATTYRCETGNTVSYSDQPCLNGKERSLDIDPANPTEADKAAAIERAKAEQARLRKIEAEYEKERKELAAEQKRNRQEKQTKQRHCAKLELKIKREHEDLRMSTGRSAEKQRTQLRRAEEDYAIECKN